jgi:hypothetical protein
MNEEEQRKFFETHTKDQLIEFLVSVLENETKLRKELDKIKGIIR